MSTGQIVFNLERFIMKYIKKFSVVLLSFIMLKSCINKEVLDLSKVVDGDVSSSRLTLAVLDNNCMSAYDKWLEENNDRIAKTFISSGVRVHLMKKMKSYYDDEYVYVLQSDQLNSFNVDVDSFKSSKSKLLIFGSNSLKSSTHFSKKFGKTIDASHECK